MTEFHTIPSDHIPSIAVTGHGRANITADRASFTIRVQAKDPDQRAAYARRTRAVDIVHRVIQALPHLEVHDEAVADRAGYGNEAVTAAWECTVTAPDTTAESLAQLAELTARLAAVEDCLIEGPEWRSSPSEVEAASERALEQAAVAARDGATALLAPLGGQVIGVAEIRPSILQSPFQTPDTEGPAPAVARLAAAVELPARTLEVNLNPPTKEITADVTVIFTARFDLIPSPRQ